MVHFYCRIFIILLSLFSFSSVQATSLSSTESLQLKPDEFDLSVSPCQDLNAFVNGKWMAKTPIPHDKIGWGNFYLLHQRALLTQHNMIKNLVSSSAKLGSIEQQLYDFYRSGMDQKILTKRVTHPLNPC